jgi:alkanesulfonate monooxygenase SsuD/methylene tetrahydromethanopterin reductase-like flavin-dependent oxidoreductase (luciferase family)
MAQARGDFMIHVQTRKEIDDGAFAIVGSVETVRQKMSELIEWYGVGNVLALLQMGTLPAELTRKNMELYAGEVLPYLRERFRGTAAHAA